VIVTSYVDVCPEGTLSTYTATQTQIIYIGVPGETSQPAASISMVTTAKVIGTETLTLTVPYTYPSASATPTAVTGPAGNVGTLGCKYFSRLLVQPN
jgi:hypothetical protein